MCTVYGVILCIWGLWETELGMENEEWFIIELMNFIDGPLNVFDWSQDLIFTNLHKNHKE